MMILTINQRIVFTAKASFVLLRPQVAGFFYLEQPFWRTFRLNKKAAKINTDKTGVSRHSLYWLSKEEGIFELLKNYYICLSPLFHLRY
jgi:hypothetical protein